MSTSDLSPAVVHVDQIESVEVAPGITRRSLTATGFARGWLIEFSPRTQWPAVDHHETEERYFVLEGEIIEGDIAYQTGSYVTFPAGSSHQPRSERGARILGLNQTESAASRPCGRADVVPEPSFPSARPADQ